MKSMQVAHLASSSGSMSEMQGGVSTSAWAHTALVTAREDGCKLRLL